MCQRGRTLHVQAGFGTSLVSTFTQVWFNRRLQKLIFSNYPLLYPDFIIQNRVLQFYFIKALTFKIKLCYILRWANVKTSNFNTFELKALKLARFSNVKTLRFASCLKTLQLKNINVLLIKVYIKSFQIQDSIFKTWIKLKPLNNHFNCTLNLITTFKIDKTYLFQDIWKRR